MKAWWNFRLKSWYVFLLNVRISVWIVYIGVSPAGNKRNSSHRWTLTGATRVWVHPGAHEQRGQTPQNPAELHTPERRHTHQRHRRSCQCRPGGWRCRQRALRGGRGISSPRSCSRCACRPELVGLWWWHMGFRCSASRSCCCTWSFWCNLQEPQDKDTVTANADIKIFTWCPNLPLKVDERGLRRGNENHCHSGEIPFLLCLTGD